jgi:ribosomal protein S18 acetylase RimI-like enzyme
MESCQRQAPDALAGVMLRTCSEVDLPFLYRVYASSRADEMALLLDWSDAQKTAFLQFQFEAQHRHYHEHYPDARYDLILLGTVEIGRLYAAPMRNEIRLMDIALLPEYRGRGLGGGLVRALQAEAGASERFLSLHVEEVNPARRLYQRLGFVDVDDVGVYKLMHWVPPGLNPVYARPSPS